VKLFGATVAAAAVTVAHAASAPPRPTLLQATGSPGYNVVLRWSSSPGATGYRILRDGRFLASSARTSYVDQTVNGPGVFTYAIRAVGPAGLSAASNRKSIFVPSDTAPIAAVRHGRGTLTASPVGLVPVRVVCSSFVYACAGRLRFVAGGRRIGAARFAMRGGHARLVKVLLTDEGFTLLVRRRTLNVRAVAATSSGLDRRSASSRLAVRPATGGPAIAVSRPVVVFGGAVRLAGNSGHRLAGERVTVYAREYRQRFRVVGTTSTGPDGTWSYTFRPAIRTSFEAQAGPDAARSPLVFVRPRVVFEQRGRGFFAEVKGGRSFAGKSVLLQRRVRGRWVTIHRAVLGRPARVFHVRLPRGISRLRIFVPQAVAGRGYLDGFSPTVVVRR
jgi:hypothetical protein